MYEQNAHKLLLDEEHVRLWSLLLAHLLLITFPAYLWETLEGKRLNKLLHEHVKIDNLAKLWGN